VQVLSWDYTNLAIFPEEVKKIINLRLCHKENDFFSRSKGELNLAGFFLQEIEILLVKTTEKIQNF